MVGNELVVKRQSSLCERTEVPQEQYDIVRRYSKDWKIRDILEVLRKDIESINSGEYGSLANAEKAWDSEPVRRTLSRISSELLSRSPSENLRIMRQIKELELCYKTVMEMFLEKMDNFLHSIRELREDLKKTVKQFHKISRLTAQVTLATSLTEIALLTFNALRRVFHFEWNSKIFLVSTAIEIMSITTSMFALSYMKQSTDVISRDVRDENRLFMDLVIVHRKGNWIDDEVLKFFPHGIDLNFFEEDKETFEDKNSWRMYLCSVIILTNIQKDPKLLKDETFLARVKVFIESPVAEIWWHRIKIKKLLKTIMDKGNRISSKEFVADHEVHYNRTVLHLYPILIPWLLNSWNSTAMRLIFSSIAALVTLRDLSKHETEEFEKLKKISRKFGKDFKEITEICNMLDTYD